MDNGTSGEPDDTNDGNNGGGGGGGTGEGPPSGGEPPAEGEGTDNEDCTWVIETVYPCWCNGDLQGAHDHQEPYTLMTLDCGGNDKSMTRSSDCNDSSGSVAVDFTDFPAHLDLSIAQVNWLNDNCNQANSFYSFLGENGFTTDNQDFVSDLLDILML